MRMGMRTLLWTTAGALALAVALAPAPAWSFGDGTPDTDPPAEEVACDGLGGRVWGLCVAYCEAHPTPNGEHRVVDVGRAVFADKLQTNKTGAMAAVYTAISRRTAKGGAANPTFVLTGRGTFRLATPAERANEGTRPS